MNIYPTFDWFVGLIISGVFLYTGRKNDEQAMKNGLVYC